MKSFFHGHCPKCDERLLKNPLFFFKEHSCKKCDTEIYLEHHSAIFTGLIFFLWFFMTGVIIDSLKVELNFYERGTILTLSILSITIFFSVMVYGKFKELPEKLKYPKGANFKIKKAVILIIYPTLFFFAEWVKDTF